MTVEGLTNVSRTTKEVSILPYCLTSSDSPLMKYDIFRFTFELLREHNRRLYVSECSGGGEGQGLVAAEACIAGLASDSLDLVRPLPILLAGIDKKRCTCCRFMKANEKHPGDSVRDIHCYVVLFPVALRVHEEGCVVACFR